MRINHKISTIMYLDRWDQSGDIWHNAQPPPCCKNKQTNKQDCMLVDGWWFGLGLLPQDLSTLQLLSCISCNIKIICLPARAGRKLCQQDNDTRHSSKSTAEWIKIIIIIIKVFQWPSSDLKMTEMLWQQRKRTAKTPVKTLFFVVFLYDSVIKICSHWQRQS